MDFWKLFFKFCLTTSGERTRTFELTYKKWMAKSRIKFWLLPSINYYYQKFFYYTQFIKNFFQALPRSKSINKFLSLTQHIIYHHYKGLTCCCILRIVSRLVDEPFSWTWFYFSLRLVFLYIDWFSLIKFLILYVCVWLYFLIC